MSAEEIFKAEKKRFLAIYPESEMLRNALDAVRVKYAQNERAMTIQSDGTVGGSYGLGIATYCRRDGEKFVCESIGLGATHRTEAATAEELAIEIYRHHILKSARDSVIKEFSHPPFR